MPIEIAIIVSRWGYWGGLLMFTAVGIMSVWYFTIALMNHNTENAWNLEMKNSAPDWGVAYLYASADIGVNLSYY